MESIWGVGVTDSVVFDIDPTVALYYAALSLSSREGEATR